MKNKKMETVYVALIVMLFSIVALQIYHNEQQELEFKKQIQAVSKEFYFKGVEDVIDTTPPDMYVKDYDRTYNETYST